MLACARWPQTEPDRQLIANLCTHKLDWSHFLLLTRHHRLVPLVARNLQASVAEPRSPDLEAIVDELRQLAAANAVQSLRTLAELRRIVQSLQSNGLSVRVLKGLPLSQSAFGDLSLRAAGDLDLLIDVDSPQQDAILQADRILRSFGYRGLFDLHRLTPRQLTFYRAHWRDNAYNTPATDLEVDLHWALFRNRAMPGSDLCATPTRSLAHVRFGDLTVETLPPSEDLLYLCIHGTFDGWLYLKSLVDVAALVRTMSEPDLDSLASLAIAHGVLPELTAALILVRRYLAMDCWSARLLPPTDRTVAHILRYADRSLVEGDFLANRPEIPHRITMAFEFGLRRSLRYRCELLRRIVYRARMWQTFPLPDRLFALYPLLSPIEWALFQLRKLYAKPPSSVPPSK
jgi:hypothetical protein